MPSSTIPTRPGAPTDHDLPAGAEALLALVDDLQARLAVLEAWQARQAVQVVTKTVRAERVDVADPRDEAPVVELAARSTYGAIHVTNGRRVGPHVNIDADEGGHSVTRDRQPIPARAGVYIYGDEDDQGVSLEAAVGHPERRSVGEIRIASPDSFHPSITLGDGVKARGATFAHPGGGRVDILTAEDWASVYIRSADEDEAPTVGLQAGTEGLDGRGRDLADAYLLIRHNDKDAIVLGCEAPVKRPGAGYLTVSEDGDARIMLGVTAGQAGLDLLSSTRGAVHIDAGPEGAAVAVTAPVGWGQWLDKDGLTGNR